jgi:phosphatidylglycerophosphate synthase
MTSGVFVYRVEDRSILLPAYQRYLVKPFLPLLPATLNPNSITHAGHLLNLLAVGLLIALWPKAGWPFAASAVLLHLYVWCDNADGMHARRTNQCSALGEFLDHGLDQLNTVYIGFLTAFALGASPTWWILISLLIPGAAVVAYWEQASTGVFRLGMINQVESSIVLASALLTSAVFGTEVFARTLVGGISVGFAIGIWLIITILFGAFRGMIRVAAQEGISAIAPILPLFAFGASVFGAAHVGALNTVAAVTIGTGGTVYFGVSMLTHRLLGRRPHFDLQLLVGALVGLGLIVWRLLEQPISPFAGPVLVVLACVGYGVLALLATRQNLHHIGRTEVAAR